MFRYKPMDNFRLTGLTALPLLFMTAACTQDSPIGTGPVGPPIPPPPPADGPFNVVYIITDQQSYYMVSEITRNLGSDPYANIPGIETPNLDKLVKNGYTFTNCYAAQNVSGPSRFALLTGESPNGWGMYNNYAPSGAKGTAIVNLTKERAMGSLFKKAGYSTNYGGKTHLPWANGSQGNINSAPSGYGFDNYITKYDRKGTQENGFNGEGLPEKAVQFIQNYKEEKPFLLLLSFMNPHDICMSQLVWGANTEFPQADEREMWARYNQMAWRTPFNALGGLTSFIDDTYAKLPANRTKTDRFGIPDPARNNPNENYDANSYRKWRAHIWFYYGLMKQVDAEIGMVLDAIEASTHKDNTIIIFTSDHGEMAGAHGFEGKMLPYQEAQRVPLIFYGPNIPKGKIDNTTLVCNGWDVLPTILAMNDIKIPSQLHGLSLCDFMIKGEPLKRQYLYVETTQSYGVLDGRYKYTRFFIPPKADYSSPPYTLDNNNLDLLIDLQEDPGELTNLAYKTEHATTLARLQTALTTEMNKRGTAF